jgi:hypothetical protein
MLYFQPPLYTEACAASSRMENPSPYAPIMAMNRNSVFLAIRRTVIETIDFEEK